MLQCSLMKKRSFILIEILLAFVLVTLCSIPLIRQPLQLYRLEMRRLEQMERERLADWTFSEIKEKLFKNEIPWEKIPLKNKKSGPYSLPCAYIRIPGCPEKQIERRFTLKGKREKLGPQEELYRALDVHIEFFPRLSLPKKKQESFCYRLIVRRLPQQTPQKEEASSALSKNS